MEDAKNVLTLAFFVLGCVMMLAMIVSVIAADRRSRESDARWRAIQDLLKAKYKRDAAPADDSDGEEWKSR